MNYSVISKRLLFVIAFWLLAALTLALTPDATAASSKLSFLGDCTTVAAAVNISSLQVSEVPPRVITATGTWGVSGSANKVHLQYFIDGGSPWQTETFNGTGGNWQFIDGPVTAGGHVLKVVAYPMVNSTVCWQHGAEVTQAFMVQPFLCRPLPQCLDWQ